MKKDCIEFKKKKNESVRVAIDSTEFAFTSALMTEKFKGWCIDSGATSHVCNDGDLFKCMDSSLKENIKVANGDYLKSKGHRECDLSVRVGGQIRNIPVKHTMFAPDAPGNLLSVKRLADQNFTVTFDKDECHINQTMKL